MKKILVFGATYGLLIAHQLDALGFTVDIVCKEIEGKSIEKNGVAVIANQTNEDKHSRVAKNIIPKNINQIMAKVDEYEIIVLAMSEPYYSNTDLTLLLNRIGELNIPVLSVMNLPPLKFMKKVLNGIVESEFKIFTTLLKPLIVLNPKI